MTTTIAIITTIAVTIPRFQTLWDQVPSSKPNCIEIKGVDKQYIDCVYQNTFALLKPNLVKMSVKSRLFTLQYIGSKADFGKRRKLNM